MTTSGNGANPRCARHAQPLPCRPCGLEEWRVLLSRILPGSPQRAAFLDRSARYPEGAPSPTPGDDSEEERNG